MTQIVIDLHFETCQEFFVILRPSLVLNYNLNCTFVDRV
jgi:hypothetical protein